MAYTRPTQTVTLNTAIGTTEAIAYAQVEYAVMYFDTTDAASVTTLTWWACATEDGTYQPLSTSANAAAAQTVAHTQANRTVDTLRGSPWVKAVANAAGVMTISCTEL